ncbi:MAG: DUF2461 family protein [Pseudomonadota bacterium]
MRLTSNTLAAMAGLTPETFAYLRDLAATNDRVWFEDNRDRYNAHRMTPAKSVVAALGQVVEGFRPPLRAEPALKKVDPPDQPRHQVFQGQNTLRPPDTPDLLSCTLTDETLKRLPPGVVADHPAATLLLRKGLVEHTIMGGQSPQDAVGAQGLDRMVDIMQRVVPINAWPAARVS